MKYTPENITKLEPNQVFIYGANEAGIHGAGAAKQALKWGARMGEIGFNGRTYGIPTKDKDIDTLSLEMIEFYIDRFLSFAKCNPELEFLVTKIGCGLAGYKETEIGSIFMEKDIPDNVILPIEFWAVGEIAKDETYWLEKFQTDYPADHFLKP